jgi:hypothetical protein
MLTFALMAPIQKRSAVVGRCGSIPTHDQASADCKLKARGDMLVSLAFASWNQIEGWLRRLECLRDAA